MKIGDDLFFSNCDRCGHKSAAYKRKDEAEGALIMHKAVCPGYVKTEDAVNHPSHYQGKVETIDAIESACAGIGPDAFKGYLTGNIVKYMSRWSRKGGAQDLKKAAWYLAKLLEVVKP